MIKNLKFKIKNFQEGITLIEIVVMLALIAIFSSILISDFPKIQRQFMLSRASHKLSQDIRRAQDLALSGRRPAEEDEGEKIAGYGIYFNTSTPTQYKIYEDKVVDSLFDKKYTDGEDVENIDMADFASGVHIKEINPDKSSSASINFSPPNPLVMLTVGALEPTSIEIILCMNTYCSEADSPTFRIVSVNKSGLIEIK